MTIGIDFRMGGSVNAGIGRYVFELLKAVLEIDRENRYVVFYNESAVAKDDLGVLGQHKNVELVPTNIRHYSLAEQVRLPKVLNAHNLDLVHFPNFNVPVRYNKPYVVTIHDMVHHRIGGHKKTHLVHFKAYQYVMQKAAERARIIITPSEAAKKDIAHYFPYAEQKTKVIYEGVTLAPQPDERVARVKKTFLISRPYFLFVGTLERKKNIVALARGFDEFLSKYKLDMDLVFAGKTDQHAPDERYKAMDIRHKDRLVFTGFVSDEDLAALYQGAYAYANASMNEGFGLPGVEAMQFGLPLLVSNSPVFNEVYDSAAIYFDAANPLDIAEKMRLVAGDTQFYEQLRAKSLGRSQYFSWGKAAEETLRIYKEAAGEIDKEVETDEIIPEE
jgi:glycosyltransferase involved in cell wall biosynthesis